VARFRHVHAIGLASSVAQINRVKALFGAQYEITPIPDATPPEESYTVAHTTEVCALERGAGLAWYSIYGVTVADMTQGIREIL
jgi:cytochrome oxidase Cu insertion factor (SCO1/SenC/PrrC family)